MPIIQTKGPASHLADELLQRPDIAKFLQPVRLAMSQYITMHGPSLDTVKSASMLAGRGECVTILGPTGTGKELIARILHGNRPADTFKVANCAGLVDTLFQSQLFGYVRGAFTGATTDRPGLITSARDGTMFLDEIGDMPLHQQASLLRVLQERKIQPVGSVEEIPVRCRFVFATNRDLRAMVEAGTFREDLYYRITEFELRTYALVDRPEDAALILQQWCRENPGWSMPDRIPSYAYEHGNVRALRKWMLHREVLGTDLAV